mgnify:CR=1 FL=1
MAVGKEIRTKIKSVQNTQKITRAMQMVATSKMRKTQDRMRAARPYAEKVRQVMAHLAQTNPDANNPLLAKRSSVKRAGVILITSDKGLAGGLNANLLRRFCQRVDELMGQGVNYVTGDYSRDYFGLLPSGDEVPAYNVFSRRDGTIRHFWSGEMTGDSADPGQDPRGAPDLVPLWNFLDMTPEGRGGDWYPSLDYK